MKKVILLSAIFSLLFVSCNNDDEGIDVYGPNNTIVGFTDSYSSNFGTNVENSTLSVPVNLIAYEDETLPTEDVTVQYTIDASSTAVAGLDYDVPSNESVVLPAGSTVGFIPVTVHPNVFDPGAPKVLVFNLTTVTSNNAIVGFQYKQVTVTLQGVCISELAGEYSTVTTRVDNGTQYFHDLETFVLVEGGTYTNDFIGAYHGSGQTPGFAQTTSGATGTTSILANTTSAGFTFTEICGKIKVETQPLGGAYLNDVRQSAAQFDQSVVNEETGVVTIAYSIYFSDNTVERKFISVYTPIN